MSEIKKYLQKNWPTVVALLLFLLLGLYHFGYGKINGKEFLGIIIPISTIYFGILKYRIENDQMFMNLFNTFNEKYDDKLNDIFNELRRNETKVLSDYEKNSIMDYFNLCAEEFLWFEKGRIPKKVWKAWKIGIQDNLKLPKIKTLYEEEIKRDCIRISFYGLVEELRKEK